MSGFQFESARTLPGSDALGRSVLAALRLATQRLWTFEVEGINNVPSSGPAIIAPNHLSFCDSIFVPAALPRRTWALGKAEYMDSWKTKHIFPAMGMIPVDRSGGKAALRALDGAADVLDAGHLFMIYPEGTRSRSEFLHRGRTGAARLAARCNAPVIPTGHTGTTAVQPPGCSIPKVRLPVTVRFGTPMHPDDFGYPDDPRSLRSFTDALMYEIAELSGQRYVHQYASGADKPGELAEKPKAKIAMPPGRRAPTTSDGERTPEVDVRDQVSTGLSIHGLNRLQTSADREQTETDELTPTVRE